MTRRLVVAPLVLFVAACSPPPSSANVFTDLGSLTMPAAVTARDGGASVPIDDQVLWMFGDTLMTVTAGDGFTYRSATAAWGGVDSPLALDEPLDERGAPYQLFPYTVDEAAYNTTNGPMERYALWPGSAIPAPGGNAAWIFYQRLLVHPGDLNYQALDVGLARLTSGSTIASRDPAPLFTAPTPAYALAAVVDGGFVYLYGVTPVAGELDSTCTVVRAPLESAPDPTAWTAWDGAAWNADLTGAATVLHGPPGDLSVSFNAHLGAFLAVYSGIFSNDVWMRTAPRPEGPWSDARKLFTAIPPTSSSDTDYAGKEHPELARDGGAQLVVSTARSTGNFQGEVRLALVPLP
ncbi:MAG TPA: DUF4185 domain-containing protein [Polyangia bacterium]|nr:DUF4185 domain-containing protein [Polyangia bacterium]